MRQISGIKRLVLGLGVMVIGVLSALPFRHANPPETTSNETVAWNPVTLGEGASLQVPGQMAVTGAQRPELGLEPTAEGVAGLEVESETPSQMAKLASPPPLPDQYRPLFRSNDPHKSEMGRVVESGAKEPSRKKPPKKHRIRDGDTLASLAERYLGDRERAGEILAANRSVLDNPEVLPIGVQILIPRPEGNGGPDPGSNGGGPAMVPLPKDRF